MLICKSRIKSAEKYLPCKKHSILKKKIPSKQPKNTRKILECS